MSFVDKHTPILAAFLALCSTIIIFSYILRIYKPYTFAAADIGWQVLTTQSLAEDGDLDLKNQLNNDFKETLGQVSLGKNGEWYPLHEILMPIVAVPFWKFLGINGCLFVNALIAIGATVVMFYICLTYASANSSFFAALLTLSSSLLLGYSYSFSGDLFGAFLFLLAYYNLVNKRFLSSGFYWGLAVIARMLNAFSLPVMIISVILLVKKEENLLSSLGLFFIGGLPAFLFFSVTNYLMFGHPLETAYDHWLAFDTLGNASIMSFQGYLTKDFWKSLIDVLFMHDSGLFVGAPLFLLAIGVCFSAKKINNQAFIFILTVFSFLIFSTVFFAFPGDWGNRYLMSVSLLSAVPLALVFDKVFLKLT